MVTVSEEKGLELIDIQDGAFTAEDVISHLKELRLRNKETPLAIFLD